MTERLGRIQIYTTLVERPFIPQDTIETTREFRWRRRAANGRIICGSTEGYRDPRDLVHNLEQSMPGWKLVWIDEEDAWATPLERPGWYLESYNLPDIPVSVPKGMEDRFKARRQR